MTDNERKFWKWRNLCLGTDGFKIDGKKHILRIPPNATKELVRARITARYFLFSE